MGTTKKCPYCGQEIDVKSKFCVFCGAKQEVTPDSPQGITYETGVANFPDNTGASLFKSCFWEQITKHYCDFKGSVDRKTFWIWYLYYSLILFVINGFSLFAPVLGILLMIVSSGLLLPLLGLYVRRLRDIGKKWTWIFIVFIGLISIILVPLLPQFFSLPIGKIVFVLISSIGLIWFYVLMALKGKTHNPNKWTVKDTIITVMMVVGGFGLFYFSGSSNNTESDFFTPKEETELRQKINEIQIGLNEKNIPFIDYCSDNMKKMYNSVKALEEAYGVECECVKIVRQIDSDHVVIEPTEFYKLLLSDEETGDVLLDGGSAVVNLKFDHYSDQEVSLHFNIERKKSWYSRDQIKNVVIDGFFIEDENSLYRCMKDWVYVMELVIAEEYEQ